MTTHDLTGLQTRSLELRSATLDTDTRTFTAIGVPYGQIYDTGYGYRERFEAGSVDASNAILCWRHNDPIGKITATRDTEDGLEITAEISRTARGDEAYELLKDGVMRSMSIGFRATAWREDEGDGSTITTITAARAIEFSLVTNPAYPAAEVLDVRHTLEGNAPMTTTTVDPTEVTQLREAVDTLERKMQLIEVREPEPAVDTRSLAEVVKAIAGGDTAALDAFTPYHARSFDGGKLADDGRVKTPTFVRDLVDIVDTANPLAKLFATGPLPAHGETLEYSQLGTNTTTVAKQENEGDELAKGKVTVTTKTATIETFGGAASMSFQKVLRSHTNMVALQLKGLGIAAGVAAADSFNTFMEAQIKARRAKALTMHATAANQMTRADIVRLLLKATKEYRAIGQSLDFMVVDEETFMALSTLENEKGQPLMPLTGTNDASVGTLSIPGLRGSLAHVTVYPNFDATSDGMGTNVKGAFFNKDALRVYSSGLGHLQDDAALTLTRDMSVYYFAAHAAEIPSAILPVKIGS